MLWELISEWHKTKTNISVDNLEVECSQHPHKRPICQPFITLPVNILPSEEQKSFWMLFVDHFHMFYEHMKYGPQMSFIWDSTDFNIALLM